MNQTIQKINNYKKYLTELLRRDFMYFTIGTVVIFGFFIVLFGTFYNKNFFSIKPPIKTTDLLPNSAAINIEKLIKSSGIDDLSPTPSPKNSLGLDNLYAVPTPTITEMGQISAISSSRVTSKGKTYTVQEGDSLATIAEKVYGDLNAWMRIAEANNLVDNPDGITVGMILQIPR